MGDSDGDLSFEESLAISALEDAVDESLKLYNCSNEPFNSYDELENMQGDELYDDEQQEYPADSYVIQRNEVHTPMKVAIESSPRISRNSDRSGDSHNVYETPMKVAIASSPRISRNEDRSGEYQDSYDAEESMDGHLSGDLRQFMATDEESDYDFSYISCSEQGDFDMDSDADPNQDMPNRQAPKEKKKKKKISVGKNFSKKKKKKKKKKKS